MTFADVPRIVFACSDTASQQWLPLPSPYTEADARAFVGSRVTAADSGDELTRSEEHTSELQSRQYLVCRLLLEKNKKTASIARASSRPSNASTTSRSPFPRMNRTAGRSSSTHSTTSRGLGSSPPSPPTPTLSTP